MNYIINNKLAEIFYKSEMTQKEFAKKIGVNKDLLHDWLKSRNQIRFDRFEEIMKKLDKEIEIYIK